MVEKLIDELNSGRLCTRWYAGQQLPDRQTPSDIILDRQNFLKKHLKEFIAHQRIETLPTNAAASGVRGVAVDMEAGGSGAGATNDETAMVRFEKERHALFIRQSNETIVAQQAAAAWSTFQLEEGRKNASEVASKAAKEAEAAAKAAEKATSEAAKAATEAAAAADKAAIEKQAAEAKAASEAAKAAAEAAKAASEAAAAADKAAIEKKAAEDKAAAEAAAAADKAAIEKQAAEAKAASEAAKAAAEAAKAAAEAAAAADKAAIEKKAVEDKAAAEVAKAASEAAKAASEAAKAAVEAAAAEAKAAIEKKAAEEKADIDKKATAKKAALEEATGRARLKVAELEAQLAEEEMQESRKKKRKQDNGKQQAEKAIAALEDVVRKASARPEADLSKLATLYVESKGVTRGHARRTANAVWDDAQRAAAKEKAKAARAAAAAAAAAPPRAGLEVNAADEGVFVLAADPVRNDCQVAVGCLGQPSELAALASGFTHRRAMLSMAGVDGVSREKKEVMHWMRAVGIGNVIYDSSVLGDNPSDDRNAKYKRALQACCEYWNRCFNCAQSGHFIVNPDKTRRCTAPPFSNWYAAF